MPATTRDPPDQTTRADTSGQSPRAAAPRVLLAEDDYELRDALSALLEADGFEVHTAPHGAAMLDFLSSWILHEDAAPPVDVIITDVRMPGFNGLSIVEGLRANGWDQPVIAISAFGDDVMRDRIQRLGSTRFFAKPFDPEALEAAVLSCASRRRR